MKFVQNPHDHPLFLHYKGTNQTILKFKTYLEKIFGDSFIYYDQGKNILKLSEVWPLHIRNKSKDYIIFAPFEPESTEETAEQTIFLGLNHLFHDIRSAAIILQGDSILSAEEFDKKKGQISESIIKRVPLPSESRGQGVIVKMTTLILTKLELETLKTTYEMTTNEIIFWKTNEYLFHQLHLPSVHMICLHNMRKELNISTDSLGDYSCYVQAMPISSQELESTKQFQQNIKDYFAKIRSNEIVLQEDSNECLGDPLIDRWIYDSWIGSNITYLSQFDLKLNEETLMESLLHIVPDRFVIVLNSDENIKMFVFYSK